MWLKWSVLVLSAWVVCGAVAPALAQDRGVQEAIVYEAPEGGNRGLVGEVQLYRRSHAVVIGIDDYAEDSVPDLSGAVRDATAVADVLTQQHGFAEEDVHVLLDAEATRINIADLLSNTLRNTVGPEDRVLVYFAGHGTTLGALGYILPVEGDFSRPGATGVSMNELQGWLEGYRSQHILFVADSCYSGLGIPEATTRGPADHDGIPGYLRKALNKKIRMALVAGSSDEQVLEWVEKEHGLFTYYFLEGLRGAADTDNDGLITGDELASYIKPKVRRTAFALYNAEQNPHMGRRGEGEFMFVTPGAWAAGRCPPDYVWADGGCVQAQGEGAATQRGQGGAAPRQDGGDALLWTGAAVGGVGVALLGVSLYGSAFVIGPAEDDLDTSDTDAVNALNDDRATYRNVFLAGAGATALGATLVALDLWVFDEDEEEVGRSFDVWTTPDAAGASWRATW